MSDPLTLHGPTGELIGAWHPAGAITYGSDMGDIALGDTGPMLAINRDARLDDLLFGCFATARTILLAAESVAGPEEWPAEVLALVFDEPVTAQIHKGLEPPLVKFEPAARYPRRVVIVATEATARAWMAFVDAAELKWTGRVN